MTGKKPKLTVSYRDPEFLKANATDEQIAEILELKDKWAELNSPTPEDAEAAMNSWTVGQHRAHASSTWSRRNIEDVLNGTRKRPEANVGVSPSGAGCMYRSRVHIAYGESTAGKTWFSLMQCRAELDKGHVVAYIDPESDDTEIIPRLMDMGVGADVLRERFIYIRPEESIADDDGEKLEMLRELVRDATLVIIDGVTEHLSYEDLDPNSSTDFAAFMNVLPRKIAEVGPAVLLIDHTNKNSPEAERYPSGTGHKVNAMTGCSFKLYNVEPIRPGDIGTTRVWIAKDRPGGVNGVGQMVSFYGAPKFPLLGVMVVNAEDEFSVSFAAYDDAPNSGKNANPVRSAERAAGVSVHEVRRQIMAEVTRLSVDGPVGRGKIVPTAKKKTALSGNRNLINTEFTWLANEGYLLLHGRGPKAAYSVVRDYVESEVSDDE